MSKEAIEHYEAALKEAFPSGATGDVFHHWNEARKALAEQPAQQEPKLPEFYARFEDGLVSVYQRREDATPLLLLRENLPDKQPAQQQEPFGYFKAEPFGWTDCAETDEGAIALYEHPQPAQPAPLLQSKKNFEHNFGQHWQADWIYSDLAKLLGASPQPAQQQEPLINRVSNKLFGDIWVSVPNILPSQQPTESVLIDGEAYTVPAQVAAEMLRLHLEIKSAQQEFVCSTGLCHYKAQQQEPVGALILGGIIDTSDGPEYEEWDIEWNHKAIESLQERLVTYNPVTLNIYTSPPAQQQQKPVTDKENEKFRRDVSNFAGADPEATKYALEEFLKNRTSPPASKPEQQEPVAWAWRNTKTDGRGIYWENPTQFYDLSKPSDYEWTPLYTSPPPQRKPLTDEQILAANYPDGEENGPTIAAPDFELICFARQIEAKLKEKNQ